MYRAQSRVVCSTRMCGMLCGLLLTSSTTGLAVAQSATSEAQNSTTGATVLGPKFGGKIDRDVRKSVPEWPKVVTVPKGAPNVLLILIDDVGFSTTSTFGGPVPTPAFDKLATAGLRYNEFHVNAICAPSRAALLSGRNNHEIGFGTITEHAQGYPGYNSVWPKQSASVAKVLNLTATTRQPLVNGTTRLCGRSIPPGRLTAGRPERALIISTAFFPPSIISTRRACGAIPRRLSLRQRPSRAITWKRT